MTSTGRNRLDSLTPEDLQRLASLPAYRRNGSGQHIQLGDLVRQRSTGRVGFVTMVTRTDVFVKWDDSTKAAQLPRATVDLVSWLVAQEIGRAHV